jgi:hypothetical protein
MTAALYPYFKEQLGLAQVQMLTDDIRVVLVDTGAYTYNASHQHYDDLSGIIGTETALLTGKTWVNGLFDADNTVFDTVPSGTDAEAIVIFKDTGNVATDLLIAFIDGFVVDPNGNDIPINWNVAGIFQL